jgi:hypothetical protein
MSFIELKEGPITDRQNEEEEKIGHHRNPTALTQRSLESHVNLTQLTSNRDQSHIEFLDSDRNEELNLRQVIKDINKIDEEEEFEDYFTGKFNS